MFGSKRFMNYQRKQLSPDLTPLIDVVFLLLIFFMVATTFDDMGGVKIELPKSQIEKIEELTEKVSILMTKDNLLKIKTATDSGTNITDVNKEDLKEKLALELTKIKNKRVAIMADRELDYGEVIDIISDIKLSGAESIDIETKRK
ncbi:biopolymer transporter ExbD [Cetobacterium sp. 2A]|uniref:ExbD/TolR family protein n=1 Tax=Cetobacterium sp. 2A TaxID=2754723 RepID=UPI002105F607|nr:biopolymer transporter ExbD [Cetobacterium sp. 2A]